MKRHKSVEVLVKFRVDNELDKEVMEALINDIVINNNSISVCFSKIEILNSKLCNDGNENKKLINVISA